MRIPASSLSTGVILLLSTCLGGCLKFYGYCDVTVAVHDAETGKPIPNAQVDLHYLYMMVINAPKPTSGKTGNDGQAVIRAASFETQDWNVSADGYLPDNRYDIDKESSLDFRLYRKPAPMVTIIVPNDFRGPLMVERRQIKEPIRDTPGHRQFTFHTSSNGLVLIAATQLLMRVRPSEFTAAFENGKPIQNANRSTGSYETALREVTSSGPRILFIVGDEEDVENFKPKIYTYMDGDPRNYSLNETAFNALFDAATAKVEKAQ